MNFKKQNQFKLVSKYKPAGDQPTAIAKLLDGIAQGKKDQVLLGATGTGKTFTMANIIANQNRQTLVLAHNKTLAMQIYYELKEFFPENRVEYFVSNFDFFQPEAYLPSKDLYIDKDARQNIELDMMRLSAMNALMTRNDTIVVASVASIYAAQDPEVYRKSFFELNVGQKLSKKELLMFFVKTGYTRNDIENAPGTFSVKGDVIKIVPG
jgi:excinuclease ABC subunit B